MSLDAGKLARLILVQLITISRAAAALVFVYLAYVPELKWVAVGVFTYAALSDFLDGYLARRFQVTTQVGKALDLFGDKFLTVVSVLYVGSRGVPLIPCCIVVIREVLLMSLRGVQVDGQPLVAPNRTIGGLTVIPIRLIVFGFLLGSMPPALPGRVLIVLFWTVAVVYAVSLFYKLWTDRQRILKAFTQTGT